MLISKFKTKSGKIYVSILVSPSFVKEIKNKNNKTFYKITLANDFNVGLDKKKNISVAELFSKVELNN